MNNPITYVFATLLTLALIFMPTDSNAKVAMKDEHTLYITGNTTNIQAALVKQRFTENPNIKRVIMYGPGGDFFAGLTIGMMLKEHDVVVQVPTNSYCISACAFAAMASRKIMLGGELWFHKPFRPRYHTSESLEDLDRGGQTIGLNIAYYAYIMELPVRFFFEVIGTTSHCKYLIVDTTSEIRKVQNATFNQERFGYSRHYEDECKTSYER